MTTMDDKEQTGWLLWNGVVYDGVPDSLATELTSKHREIERLQRELGSARWNEQQAWKTAAEMEGQRNDARRERDKLQAFKDWVHGYLDEHGVPTHPNGPRSKEGCRIGDRLDIIFRERDEAMDDAARYRVLRRKVAIIDRAGILGNAMFEFLNLPYPTCVAPDAAIELDAVIDGEVRAVLGGEG